jgi:thiamine-phosphate pyrophosphorylase
MRGVETLNEARGKLAREARRLNVRHGDPRLPALVLMTDDERTANWSAAIEALPAGAAVILRHRDAEVRAALARLLKPICRVRRVKLLIADDMALAQRVGADGVHIPEARNARLAAAKAAHPNWLVSTSAHSERALVNARHADMVLISPVFETASHVGRRALGVVRFAAIARRVRGAYALGGIDATSISRLAGLPIAGIALIGGWLRRS